jgi:hypothetical protein
MSGSVQGYVCVCVCVCVCVVYLCHYAQDCFRGSVIVSCPVNTREYLVGMLTPLCSRSVKLSSTLSWCWRILGTLTFHVSKWQFLQFLSPCITRTRIVAILPGCVLNILLSPRKNSWAWSCDTVGILFVLKGFIIQGLWYMMYRVSGLEVYKNKCLCFST